MSIGVVLRDEASSTFLDAAKEGNFVIKSCDSCSEKLSPKALACSRCHSEALSWVKASGTGRVVSWTVVPGRVFSTVTTDEVVFGIVELDEGPWWWAQLAMESQEAFLGKAVEVAFEPSEDGVEMVPVFASQS